MSTAKEVHVWAPMTAPQHTIGKGHDCHCEPDIILDTVTIDGEACRVFIHHGAMLAVFGPCEHCAQQD